MKDLIEKLSKQAGITEDDLSDGNMSLKDLEKFAKLIVKECAAVCRDGISTDDDLGHSYWDQACANRASAIEKYFEVE